MAIVTSLRSQNITEEESINLVNRLRNGVIDPKITNYIFYSCPQLTPDEIARKALEFKPIIL